MGGGRAPTAIEWEIIRKMERKSDKGYTESESKYRYAVRESEAKKSKKR